MAERPFCGPPSKALCEASGHEQTIAHMVVSPRRHGSSRMLQARLLFMALAKFRIPLIGAGGGGGGRNHPCAVGIERAIPAAERRLAATTEGASPIQLPQARSRGPGEQSMSTQD